MSVRGPESKKPAVNTKPQPAATAKKPAKTEAQQAPKNVVAKSAGKPNTAAEDRKGKSNFADHAASVDIAVSGKVTPAAQGGKRVADAVMQCIGSYDRTFLLDTDGLKAHVQQVATRFVETSEQAQKPGSVYKQLASRFPGAQISLAGTASTQSADQLVYLVRGKGNQVQKFVEKNGKPFPAPNASNQIFMAADLGKKNAHMAVRVPEVRFLINPTLPPSYGVGRTIAVMTDQDLSKLKKNSGDSVTSEFDHVYKETLPGTQKGEDGKALGVVYSDKAESRGTILKYNGDHTYQVEVTLKDGTKKVVTQSEQAIRSENDPMVYNLHGSTFDDVSINVDSDPKLVAFLAQAKAVADKDIPKSGTPDQVAAGQKQALVDLTILCNKTMSYPDESATTTDANSKTFMQLSNSHSNWDPMKLGDLIGCGRGVCRHQAILMQLACQTAGIASRTVSASANDHQGNFRGYHAFLETTLDDGTQFLTDPTWFDAGPQNVSGYNFSPVVNGQQEPGTPLWDTLYFNVLRDVLPTWQDNHGAEDHSQVKFNESNDPVIGGTGTPGGSGNTGNSGALDAKKTAAAIVADLHSVRVSTSTKTPVARGDAYLAAGSPDKAAKEYARAIANGVDGSKAVWQKLASALSAAGKTADAAKANQVLATL